jgi:hypothetical protein
MMIKRQKAFLTAGGVFTGLNLLAGWIMGFDKLLKYYLTITGATAGLYRAHDGNYSIWSLGYRLFEGMFSEKVVSVSAPPLAPLPGLAPVVSAVAAIAFLLIMLWKTWRLRSIDAGIAILVCASILVSPIAWNHYLLLALLPAAILLKMYLTGRFSAKLIITGIGAGLLLLWNSDLWYISLALAGYDLSATNLTVPFLFSLLTYLPAAALLCLSWLLHRAGRLATSVYLEEPRLQADYAH